MLTFKVEAKYGQEQRAFSQNVIAHTPELAGEVAERFIRSKMLGGDAMARIAILQVREVRH